MSASLDRLAAFSRLIDKHAPTAEDFRIEDSVARDVSSDIKVLLMTVQYVLAATPEIEQGEEDSDDGWAEIALKAEEYDTVRAILDRIRALALESAGLGAAIYTQDILDIINGRAK